MFIFDLSEKKRAVLALLLFIMISLMILITTNYRMQYGMNWDDEDTTISKPCNVKLIYSMGHVEATIKIQNQIDGQLATKIKRNQTEDHSFKAVMENCFVVSEQCFLCKRFRQAFKVKCKKTREDCKKLIYRELVQFD